MTQERHRIADEAREDFKELLPLNQPVHFEEFWALGLRHGWERPQQTIMLRGGLRDGSITYAGDEENRTYTRVK